MVAMRRNRTALAPAIRRWVAVLLLALVPAVAAAQSPQRLDVYVFWAIGCPHCEREIEFLKRLEAREPRLKVHYLEITRSAGNRAVLAAIAHRYKIERISVPVTLVGDAVMMGYATDASSGAELTRGIAACLERGCPDVVAPLFKGVPGRAPGNAAAPAALPGTGLPVRLAAAEPREQVHLAALRDDAEGGKAGAAASEAPSPGAAPGGMRRMIPPAISVPILGEVRTADFSLPVLTVVLGALDGFNPCAMWVLVFLIGLLLGIEDRSRMWVLGTAFIAVSGLVYFVFMAAWLNLLLFIGAVAWVRAAVGVVALAGGFHYLREYFRNPDAVCKVTAPESRRRVFESLRRLATESRFWFALAGIVALAFAVNLVELICSAGIPAVYTQVLALSNLPAWQYYGYIVLYILVFMLDDLLVFVIAMKTLQVAGATGRYTRFSNLAGGLVLLPLGILLLLRPEWLMFG
ncbi:MAG: hypothetical protein IT529_08890 [Burkholderiales bacterium]|nr:hypothetical protein [Burkholderiales bacterium]